jgi:hypothetical protein
VPRKRQMTWQAGSKSRSGRWRKKHKGRVFQASGGRGKHDEDAYRDAWDGFQEFKKKITEEECIRRSDNKAGGGEWRAARFHSAQMIIC